MASVPRIRSVNSVKYSDPLCMFQDGVWQHADGNAEHEHRTPRSPSSTPAQRRARSRQRACDE